MLKPSKKRNMTSKESWLLLYILILFGWIPYRCQAADDTCTGQFPLVQHGLLHGDTLLRRVDDGASSLIPLSPPIPLFGRNETTGYVGSNGYFSFGIPSSAYNYAITSFPIVAPFWADIDIREYGSIAYRRNFNKTQCIPQILQKIFLEPNFQVKASLAATYVEVRQYGNTGINRTNSFQVVLVSNGELSFAFFSYGDIQWEGGAFIGFHLGDSRRFSVPGSLTPDVADIETRSNVGVPGLFVYRVDQGNIIEPSRNYSTDIKLGAYPAKNFLKCSQREQIQDGIIRDVVQLLSNEYGFEPLGRLREFPATSCEEINHTHFQPGLYWISQDGMEPTLQYCVPD